LLDWVPVSTPLRFAPMFGRDAGVMRTAPSTVQVRIADAK
jgi:hypothetical protein